MIFELLLNIIRHFNLSKSGSFKTGHRNNTDPHRIGEMKMNRKNEQVNFARGGWRDLTPCGPIRWPWSVPDSKSSLTEGPGLISC